MVSSKCAEKFDKFRNAEIVNVKRLVKAVQVDATAVGAKALANAVGKFTDTLFSTGDSSTKESIVHSFVEARRCASIVAFDASAVVSSADVTDFTKAVEMCIAEEQGAVQYKNFTQHAGFTLTDGSGRGDAFDGSEQTALIEKCCFPVVKEMPEGVPVLDTLTSNDSSISSASPPSELAQRGDDAARVSGGEREIRAERFREGRPEKTSFTGTPVGGGELERNRGLARGASVEGCDRHIVR